MKRSLHRKKTKRRVTPLRAEALEPRIVLDSGGGAGQLASGALVYSGGPLLANVNLVPIYLQDSASSAEVSTAQRAQFNAFLGDLAGNGYLPDLVGEFSVSKPKPYTIGNGTLDAKTDINVKVTATNYTPKVGGPTYQAIADAQIQTIIQNEINAGRTSAPNANNLYVVFTPPGDVVTNSSGDSISNFYAYHTSFTDSASNVEAYAVVPFQASPNETRVGTNQITAFQATTQSISHEVAEAASDVTPFTGWANPVGGGENGDQAGGEGFTRDGYLVQYEWSNNLLGPAHAVGTGSGDLFINQLSPPATTGFSGGPVATFTTANHSLTAADFTVAVGANNGSFGPNWTTSVSGGNGFFTIDATPPAPLTVGQVGTPLKQTQGLNVFVWDKAAGGPGSGAPMSYRYQPFNVRASAPLIYNADQGGVTHNFVLKENTATKNFELTDNGLLVFTQPISQTTNISIGADPGIDASLTIDYGGGAFTNKVTFDGGTGAGTHTLTLTGGSFTNDKFTPTGTDNGVYTLDGQTVSFLHVKQTNDLTTATNFTAKAEVDDVVSSGPSVNGVSTQTVNGGGGFLGVNFANKTVLVGPYLLVGSDGSTPSVLHVQTGPIADNLTLQVDPASNSNMDVIQSGLVTPLGKFALSAFTSIQINGSGSLTLDYANGLFGKPITDIGTSPATLAIASVDSTSYHTSGNTTTITVDNDATNVVTATNVQVVFVTGQPQNLLEMAGETCIFTAEAASTTGQPLTAKWQFKSNGGSSWTDVTDPVTNLATDAGEKTRLTFEMASSKGGQYRAAFSADHGASYAYSRAATLTYAAPELGNVTYWIGGGETGGPPGGPTVGDPTAWSQFYNWTNGVPDSTKIAVFVSKTDPTPQWSKPNNSGTATWTDDHPVNTNCVVDGNFSVGGLFLSAGWDDTLTVTGNLRLVLGGEWDSGTINIAEDANPTADMLNDVGAQLVLNNVNPVILDGGGTLQNDGVMIQTANANNLAIGCQFGQGNGPPITLLNNAPTGVFDIQNDASIIGANELGTTEYIGDFRNRGLLEKSGGTTTTGSTIDTPFSSWGTIEVDQGKLIVEPAGISEASPAAGADAANYYNENNFVVNHGAILDPTGGSTVSVAGTLTGKGSGTVDFSHGVLVTSSSANATLNFPGTLFHWSGGVLQDGSNNSGTEFTWTNTGRLNITAGSELYDATLHNQGTIVQTAADSLKITKNSRGALLDNQAGATFELASAAGLTYGYPYAGSFLNQGILLKMDASTSTLNIAFTNVAGANGQGVIHVEHGTLAVAPTATAIDAANNQEPANYIGASNSTDVSFIVDPGAILDPTGGYGGGNTGGPAPSVAGTLTGKGSGTVDFSHGVLVTSSSADATLNFPGALFHWSGGVLYDGSNNSGTEFTWTNTGQLNITAGSELYDATLHNQGTIVQTAADSLKITKNSRGALLDNQAGATFELASAAGFDFGYPYAGSFLNHGILLKSDASTSTINIAFTNVAGANGQGVIHVEHGTLVVEPTATAIDAANNQEPANYIGASNSTDVSFIVEAGAILDPTGGNPVSVAGTLTGKGSGTVDFSHGVLVTSSSADATLNFPGTLFHWSGGVLGDGSNNSGTEFTWTNTGQLNITAGSELYDATLHNQGTIVQTAADSLKITKNSRGALLDNQAGATFELDSAAGLDFGYPYAGSFINHGTVLKSDASTSTINIAFENSGTLIVPPSATLAFGDNYTQTSTGTLETQLAGAPSTGKFGRITVTGSATLDGTLDVKLGSGYSPALGNTFPVLTFSSESGDFASKNLPALSNGLVLLSSYAASELDLFVSQPPALAIGGPAVTYNTGGPPVAVAPLATLSTGDGKFADSKLSVTNTNGGQSDQLGIRASGSLTISSTTLSLSYGGTAIGTFKGGTWTTPLVISFNTQATQAAIQAVVRNITLQNIVSNPSSMTARTVSFQLTDGAGNRDAVVTQSVVFSKPSSSSQKLAAAKDAVFAELAG